MNFTSSFLKAFANLVVNHSSLFSSHPPFSFLLFVFNFVLSVTYFVGRYATNFYHEDTNGFVTYFVQLKLSLPVTSIFFSPSLSIFPLHQNLLLKWIIITLPNQCHVRKWCQIIYSKDIFNLGKHIGTIHAMRRSFGERFFSIAVDI